MIRIGKISARNGGRNGWFLAIQLPTGGHRVRINRSRYKKDIAELRKYLSEYQTHTCCHCGATVDEHTGYHPRMKNQFTLVASPHKSGWAGYKDVWLCQMCAQVLNDEGWELPKTVFGPLSYTREEVERVHTLNEKLRERQEKIKAAIYAALEEVK